MQDIYYISQSQTTKKKKNFIVQIFRKQRSFLLILLNEIIKKNLTEKKTYLKKN